jgi:hypothetical protein
LAPIAKPIPTVGSRSRPIRPGKYRESRARHHTAGNQPGTCWGVTFAQKARAEAQLKVINEAHEIGQTFVAPTRDAKCARTGRVPDDQLPCAQWGRRTPSPDLRRSEGGYT